MGSGATEFLHFFESQSGVLGTLFELARPILANRFSDPESCLGARLMGCTATQHSKKGSEKVLARVLGKGSGEGFSEKIRQGGWGEGLRRPDYLC